jgi:uncharacterized DUF497 family protein
MPSTTSLCFAPRLTAIQIVTTIPGMVTYDEDKRQINLARHGIDLAECGRIFDAPIFTEEDDRLSYGEVRLKSLGLLGARVVVLIWTERGDRPRLISCRYGDRDETKRYFKLIR